MHKGIRRSLYVLALATAGTMLLYTLPLPGVRLARRARAAVTAANPNHFAADSPTLVELFTSEGCSSCPPADALLAQIQREQPNAVVLSEHVDYWNYIGWTDPYSSAAASERQQEYNRRFKLASVYTPQMVIDGTYQLVGNDKRAAYADIALASAAPKLKISLSQPREDAAKQISFHLTTAAVNAPATVYAVLAQNHGSQQVDRGENGGRTLMHVCIARTLKRVDTLAAGKPFDGDVTLALPTGQSADDVHVVAFLQLDSGTVVGVATAPVGR
jgi:hypothetical protein